MAQELKTHLLENKNSSRRKRGEKENFQKENFHFKFPVPMWPLGTQIKRPKINNHPSSS